jgi:hypothetical protein
VYELAKHADAHHLRRGTQADTDLHPFKRKLPREIKRLIVSLRGLQGHATWTDVAMIAHRGVESYGRFSG